MSGQRRPEDLRRALEQTIVGQADVLEALLLALLCNGHVLLEGPPGLAKTLACRALAAALEGEFKRVQFTPDLLPSDIVGTRIFDQRESAFATVIGPIFANVVLADEINRAPAKVQSALLEAMQERQVTIGPDSHRLPDPFVVMATMNPLDSEGTYALPVAQMDRFLMKVDVGYPTREEELRILDRFAVADTQPVRAVAEPRRRPGLARAGARSTLGRCLEALHRRARRRDAIGRRRIRFRSARRAVERTVAGRLRREPARHARDRASGARTRPAGRARLCGAGRRARGRAARSAASDRL